MEPAVLNPQLYERLKEAFGSVVVHNQGEPMAARVGTRAFTASKWKSGSYIQIDSPGEYYSVCCPVCGDTRHRLWINHRWNVGYGGHRLRYLIRCYNENCDELDDFQELMDRTGPTSPVMGYIQRK